MTAIDTLTAQLGKLQHEGDYAAKRGNLWLALEMADEARKVSAEIEQLKQSAPTTTEREEPYGYSIQEGN